MNGEKESEAEAKDDPSAGRSPKGRKVVAIHNHHLMGGDPVGRIVAIREVSVLP